MKLTPIYHRDDKDYRVIYRPHSRWFAQRKGPTKATRENDPWEDLAPPQSTRDKAIEIMHQRKPLLPTKATA